MSNLILRYLLILPGCLAGPLAHANLPTPAPEAVQVAAPAPDAQPAVDYPSMDEEMMDEMEGYGCGDESDPLVDIRVRAGETLDQFARWANSSVEELADLNGIEVRGILVPGQALMLPIEGSDLDALEEERVADAEAKLARFIAKRGGLAGIAAHEVRAGDSAWAISKREAMVPLWVLSAFNTKVDMEALKPGDTIYLPVMGQTLGARFDAQAEAAVGNPVAER
jgi:LysM repeat protein